MSSGGGADPRPGVLASIRWVLAHRAWTPYHLVRYLRFLRLLRRAPHVRVEGLVFLGRRVELLARPGYGRIVLGRFSHLGDDCRLRAHEGTLRIGEKVVLGRDVTINCYLDVEVGAATIVADSVYVCDFDHRFADAAVPIKDQGIVKSPVRIGANCWLGTKVTVLRGSDVGDGSVVGAGSVVRGALPPYSLAGGIPAKVVRSRRP